MENKIKITLDLQDIIILTTGLNKYLKVYPKTDKTDRVNEILDNAFNQIINTKNNNLN